MHAVERDWPGVPNHRAALLKAAVTCVPPWPGKRSRQKRFVRLQKPCVIGWTSGSQTQQLNSACVLQFPAAIQNPELTAFTASMRSAKSAFT